MAKRTVSPDLDRQQLVNHAVFGLCAEAGEVAGLMQHIYQGQPLDMRDVCGELGDCLWFIAECCTAFGLSLDDIASGNIAKLMVRYPQGFDPVRSEHRHELEAAQHE